MRLCEVINLSPNTVKHAELKLTNQYKNKDWGKKKKIETKDVIVRSSGDGKIYGRRTIVQRA
jgi:hypothetical protein